MIPTGYMAKHVADRPDWLAAPGVIDIYSVSGCLSRCFTDYVPHWRHNGYWFFDSPGIIEELAANAGVDLTGTRLFYYEVFGLQFRDDERVWAPFEAEPSFVTAVRVPKARQLEGYDVVTFSCGTSAECSPLSCNGAAAQIAVNPHCLIVGFDDARSQVERGAFDNTEPGPLRIFAVYSVGPGGDDVSWPPAMTRAW